MIDNANLQEVTSRANADMGRLLTVLANIAKDGRQIAEMTLLFAPQLPLEYRDRLAEILSVNAESTMTGGETLVQLGLDIHDLVTILLEDVKTAIECIEKNEGAE